MKATHILLALLVVVIWGINPAISKLGMLEIPPFVFLTVRYLLTGLLFLPFAKFKRQDLKIILYFGIFFNVVNNGLSYVAYQYLDPAAAILLSQTDTPITVLMACLFARESASWRQVAGIVSAFVGVVFVLGIPEISLYGTVLILLSRIFWSICQLMFKDTRNLEPFSFLAYSSLLAAPLTFLCSRYAENYDWQMLPVHSLAFILIMVFQILGLSFANVMWQKLISWNGVVKISPFSMLQIVFALISGMFLFNERITWQMSVGILLILGGVAATSYHKRDKKTEPKLNKPKNAL